MALRISLLLLLLTSTAVAAPRVSVMTFGPGDHAFSKFGHDAILIEDGRRQLVYNFGTFRFDSPWLIVDFLKGRLQYWLSVSTLDSTLAAYRAQNRTIRVQRLELSAARRSELARALRHNALPENRYYAYDYFRDNCATRVRDVLDRATSGALRAHAMAPGRLTYREHALRLVADDWPLYVGLHLGLGAPADAATTRWDEAFLPEELAAILRTTSLVASEQTLFVAERPEVREHPPRRAPIALVIGVLAAAAAALLARRAPRAFGVALALCGMTFGLLSLALSFLWLGTDHVAAHRNENLFLLPPWTLGLVPAGVALALRKAWAEPVAFWLAAAALGSSLLGVACKLLPWFSQDNWFFIAGLVPLWIGLVAASRPRLWRALLRRRSPASPRRTASPETH